MLAVIGLPPLPPDWMELLGFSFRGVQTIAFMAYGKCYEQVAPNDWLTPGQQIRRFQRSGGYIPC